MQVVGKRMRGTEETERGRMLEIGIMEELGEVEIGIGKS